MLGRFMPIIFGALAKGEEDPEITNEHVKEIMEGGSNSDHNQILDVEFESVNVRAIVIVDPKYMREGADIEDLVGEVTLFGVISRIVGEGRTFSLEKHLLPGVNRTMRRMIAKEGVDKFVGELKELVDGDIDENAINISGPVVVIEPVAIY